VKGDLVSFVLASDINVGGAIVAKAGCRAVGEVAYARSAAVPGRSGALSLQLDYVQVGGRRIKLRGSPEAEGAGIVEYDRPSHLKWPMGLLRTGDDLEINQGTVLAAFVAEDISLPAAR
jgi:hypothetical protein